MVRDPHAQVMVVLERAFGIGSLGHGGSLDLDENTGDSLKELERGDMDCKRDVRETKGFERLTTSRKLVSTYKRLVPARKIPRFLTP